MIDLPDLNLPSYKLRTRILNNKMQIFGNIIKKYIYLTLEEWVRQNFILYLHNEKDYPLSLMMVEVQVPYNRLKTRADIVLYNTDRNPIMIVECKSPDVKITQETFYQIAKYNYKLKTELLVVTNGLQHFCCRINYQNHENLFLNEIPSYVK